MATIDLVHNYPLIGDPAGALLRDLAANIEKRGEAATRYAPVEGLPEDAEVAARWLSRPDAPIDPARVGFGISGHQLLVAALVSLTRSDDAIACDPITYNGWLNITRQVGRRNVAVTSDNEGMIPDALDRAAEQTPIWGVFLMPTIHNPRTTVMPLARRRAIVEVCRRRNLWVIDDDAYRFLHPDPPPSFAHLYPERTLWFQSLTKPLFAAIKTALFVAPTSAMTKMREGGRITGHQPSALTLPWVLELLGRGAVDEIAAAKRETAKELQALARTALAGLTFTTLETAFHLWVDLPPRWSAEAAAEALRAAGVEVVSGSAYAVDPAAMATPSIRVALAGEARRELVAEGLHRLAHVLRT